MSLFSFVKSWINGGGATARAPGNQSEDPVTGSLTTRQVTADTAMQLSAVFACVRLIAETVASLPLEFFRRAPGKVRGSPFPEHPLYRLLAFKPNRYQTRIEFWETVVMMLALHGNAYILVQRTGRTIIGLLPLMSSQVQVRLLTDGSVVYQYNDGQTTVVYAQESIWHIKLFGNAIVGLSPLGHARNSLGIAISAEDRVSRLANSGFKPSGVLMLDKVLRPDQRDQIRKSFAALVEGGDDTLRVLEAGMTYQQVSISPKDAQFLESRRYSLEDIARFFGVPSVLINDTTATTAWGSGIQQIVQGFYKLGLRPYLERIEASISVWLLGVDERWTVEPAFDFSALLRGDTAARITAHKDAILSAQKTPNECRLHEGDAPLPGGDVLYMQSQMTPLTTLAKGILPKPAPTKGAPNEPEETT